MIFGPQPLDNIAGAYLAHSLRLANKRYKKGHLITQADIAVFEAAGLSEIIVAKLDDSDVHEQPASQRIAQAIVGKNVRLDPPFTGRVNLFADVDGVLEVDVDGVHALNRIHPSVTLATLENYARVDAGRMVATLKIIPLSAPLEAVEAAEKIGNLVRVRPFRSKKVVLVATRLSSLKTETMDKTARVLDERLKRGGSEISKEFRVDHDTNAVASALKKARGEDVDLIVCFGASANVDEEDVGPAGLVAAGGELQHFGMPVDPGNLIYVGELDSIPVIGAPGCARSPAENGFDWVLDRFLADIPVHPDDIIAMGVGGLLKEIYSRPHLRESRPDEVTPDKAKVAAIVLAAGRSTRMGEVNKLLAKLDGESLVRRVMSAIKGSKVDEILVVTGHEREAVKAELSDFEVKFAHNPDYKEGLSTSLRTGINALEADVNAALIVLGDMPFIPSGAFDKLIDSYQENEGIEAVVATSNGKRGNPVLWSRRFFEELKSIHGDTGARHLIGEHQTVVAEVEIGDGASIDLDTPEALRAAAGTSSSTEDQ